MSPLSEHFKLIVDIFELALILWLFIWHTRLATKMDNNCLAIETNYAKVVDFEYLITEVKETNAGVAKLNATIDSYLSKQIVTRTATDSSDSPDGAGGHTSKSTCTSIRSIEPSAEPSFV